MTQAILTRTERAAGIVTRQECEPLEDGSWRVRDTGTGSGEGHIATVRGCDCWDYRRRGGICKHMRAIILEEQALAQFCAEWDAQAVEPVCDQYSGPYGSDGWPQPRPTCPICGAELETRSYYIGGRGYQYFEICTRDMAHHARQA